MTTLWSGNGLRVVEVGGGISAAYGARLLADFGADVIKVETLSGDEARRYGPFPNDEPHIEKCGHFLYLNFNKRAVTADIRTKAGAGLLGKLLADADVLIENLGSGRLDALPLPADALHERLVICSISPYGQDGPKADYLASELTIYAAGGMMYITGTGDRPPVKHGLRQAAHLAGVNAASATLAAGMLARRIGRGQRIDISEQETVAQTLFPALNIYSHSGGVMRRAPTGITSLVNSEPMPTSDGWIMPSYAGFSEWDAFSAFIDIPELTEERFSTPEGRRAHGAEIDRLVAPRFAERSKHDLFHEGQVWRFTFTAVQTAGDLAGCPHLEERGFFVEQEHPVAGRVRMPGMVPFASAVGREPVRHAPLLGEHNAEVFDALGLSDEAVAALQGSA